MLTVDYHLIYHCSFQMNIKNSILFKPFIIEIGDEQIQLPVHCVKNTRGVLFYNDLSITCDDKNNSQENKYTKLFSNRK